MRTKTGITIPQIGNLLSTSSHAPFLQWRKQWNLQAKLKLLSCNRRHARPRSSNLYAHEITSAPQRTHSSSNWGGNSTKTFGQVLYIRSEIKMLWRSPKVKSWRIVMPLEICIYANWVAVDSGFIKSTLHICHRDAAADVIANFIAARQQGRPLSRSWQFLTHECFSMDTLFNLKFLTFVLNIVPKV